MHIAHLGFSPEELRIGWLHEEFKNPQPQRKHSGQKQNEVKPRPLIHQEDEQPKYWWDKL